MCCLIETVLYPEDVLLSCIILDTDLPGLFALTDRKNLCALLPTSHLRLTPSKDSGLLTFPNIRSSPVGPLLSQALCAM